MVGMGNDVPYLYRRIGCSASFQPPTFLPRETRVPPQRDRTAQVSLARSTRSVHGDRHSFQVRLVAESDAIDEEGWRGDDVAANPAQLILVHTRAVRSRSQIR